MSGLMPAFARAAFGEVGLLPRVCDQQLILQYSLFFHLLVRNVLLQVGQIFSRRGTKIFPFLYLADLFGIPIFDRDIFLRHSSVNDPLLKLL